MKRLGNRLCGLLFVLAGLGLGVAPVHAQGNGVARIWARFPPGQTINDGVKLRYKFFIVANQSNPLKILFSDSRFYGSGQDTYLIEHNLYTDRYVYTDPVCTTWPLQGEHRSGESSLRVAVPDYVQKGLTGAKTRDPDRFPRQTYLIDGIPNLWKTDMISQFDCTGFSGTVKVARGGLVTNLQGWRCDGDLDPGTSFRKWKVTVALQGTRDHMTIALPDESAHYITPYEALVFYTEFFNQPGLFKVYLWDLEIQSESSGTWQPLNLWEVTDGPGTNYGFRKTSFNDQCGIEVSNEPGGNYAPAGTVIDLSIWP
jgi:hypothetical protein